MVKETKAPWSGQNTAAFCSINWSSIILKIYHPTLPLDSIHCQHESNFVIERPEFVPNTNNCTQQKEKVTQVWINLTGSSPKDCRTLKQAGTAPSDPQTVECVFNCWSSHPSIADHSPLPLLQLQNISAINSMGQNKIHLGRVKGLFENIGIHTLKEKNTWHWNRKKIRPLHTF